MTSVKKEMIDSIIDNGLITSALSVVSGLAITQTPVTIFFGLISVGTTAVVSAPIIAGAGVAGGIYGYYKHRAKREKVENYLKNITTRKFN